MNTLAGQDRALRLVAQVWLPVFAAGILAWWALMLLVPQARGHFVPEVLGAGALWAFFIPDFGLMLPATLFCWQKLRVDRPAARLVMWLVTGCMAYSALWSLGATLWAWQAPLGPLLMLPGAFICAVVAWTMQPVEDWFRVSQKASPWAHGARTVADAWLFTSAFLIVVPLVLRVFEDSYGIPRGSDALFWPCVALIVPLQALGLTGGLWLVAVGGGTPLPVDTAPNLVVSGPWAHIRNPMAATGIAQGVLLAIGLGSWVTLVYALIGGVFWHGFVRPIEEADLRRRFGASYERYHDAVPLWYPRLTPWRG